MKKRIIALLLAMTIMVMALPNAFASDMNGMIAYDRIINFYDVHENDWFFMDVLAMLEAGLMNGKDDHHFDPKGTLTNAEVAQILYNDGIKKREGGSFLDISNGTWYFNAVMECGEYFPVHWDRHQGGAQFLPNSPITRQELCYTILRASGFSDNDLIQEYENRHGAFQGGWRNYPEAAIQLMADIGVITGYENGELGGADNLTRAQCAAIFNRVMSLLSE